MAASTDLRAQVYSQYPQFAYLLEIPEVASILLRAVDPNVGFSPPEFAAQLYATNWWRSTSETQRQWQALSEVDPATAAQQTEARFGALKTTVTQLGLSITDARLMELASHTLAYGLDPNSAETKLWLMGVGGTGTPITATGDITAVFNQIKAMASNDYLITMVGEDIWDMARQVAAGAMTMDGVNAALLARSRAKYPQLGYLFEEGVTPGQFFGEHKAAIAQVMGYGSASQVDLLNDKRWANVLSMKDATGKLRPTTIPEALKIARSTDEWKRSDNGKAAAADMESYLLNLFGVRRA